MKKLFVGCGCFCFGGCGRKRSRAGFQAARLRPPPLGLLWFATPPAELRAKAACFPAAGLRRLRLDNTTMHASGRDSQAFVHARPRIRPIR